MSGVIVHGEWTDPTEAEHYEERAAIIEYCAHEPRHLAEAAARRMVLTARWPRRETARGR